MIKQILNLEHETTWTMHLRSYQHKGERHGVMLQGTLLPTPCHNIWLIIIIVERRLITHQWDIASSVTNDNLHPDTANCT